MHVGTENECNERQRVALWSSGRHLASGSEGLGFESWLCQVDVESLGKALYMHFLTSLMCKTNARLMPEWRVICNDSSPVMHPKEFRKVQWLEWPVGNPM